jgi:hypothetical protein
MSTTKTSKQQRLNWAGLIIGLIVVIWLTWLAVKLYSIGYDMRVVIIPLISWVAIAIVWRWKLLGGVILIAWILLGAATSYVIDPMQLGFIGFLFACSPLAVSAILTLLSWKEERKQARLAYNSVIQLNTFLKPQ